MTDQEPALKAADELRVIERQQRLIAEFERDLSDDRGKLDRLLEQLKAPRAAIDEARKRESE